MSLSQTTIVFHQHSGVNGVHYRLQTIKVTINAMTNKVN